MNYRLMILTIVILLMMIVSGSTLAQEVNPPITIGWLSFFPADPFKGRMTELGYVEGVDIEYVSPSYENVAMEDFFASYTAQMQAMVDSGEIDIFVVNTDSDATFALSIIGTTTPVIFCRADDPIATGAVADLINPGGNITGVMTNRPHERRLQILTEINAETDKILYLYSPLTLEGETVLHQVEAVAQDLNVEVFPVQTPDGPTAVAGLQDVPEGIDWLFLTPYVPFDPDFFQALMTVSASQRAGIAGVTDDPNQNYLVGYGPNIIASDQQAAEIADRIIRGASPAELPVQIAENYLTINLEAAEVVGLEVPVGILRQADRIVRPGYFESLLTATPVP